MRLHYKLLAYLLFSLAIMAIGPSVYANSVAITINHEPIILPALRAIHLSGNLDVEITCGTPKNTVQFFGHRNAVRSLQVNVNHGILTINRKPPSANEFFTEKTINANTPILIKINVPRLIHLIEQGTGRTTVTDLCGPVDDIGLEGRISACLSGRNIDLRNLVVKGASTVTITGLKSRHLDICHRCCGNLNLQGEMILHSLDHMGSGNITLYWINSNSTQITASGSGCIVFAGQVCQLEATLYGQVKLDARNMHAERGYIHTTDRSQAEVWVRDSLSTWAEDQSNIFYYKDSAFVGQYMEPPAAALRMTRICGCCKKCV